MLDGSTFSNSSPANAKILYPSSSPFLHLDTTAKPAGAIFGINYTYTATLRSSQPSVASPTYTILKQSDTKAFLVQAYQDLFNKTVADLAEMREREAQELAEQNNETADGDEETARAGEGLAADLEEDDYDALIDAFISVDNPSTYLFEAA